MAETSVAPTRDNPEVTRVNDGKALWLRPDLLYENKVQLTI